MITNAQIRATPVAVLFPASTAGARTSPPASVVDALVLAANPSRRGATVVNDSVTSTLYLALGTAAASLVSYTVQVLPGGYFEVPFGFAGELRGIWSVASGAARVEEFT